MAILVKHNKVSTVPDTTDTSLVRPSDWNADHTLTGFGTAAEKDAGVPNGVATLDAGGKVPVSELPAAVLGALSYQGTWNASTNTPTLTSSTGTKGYYYVVSVAGNTNLDGITDWQVGDWAVYNGSAWQKVDNTDAGGDVVGPSSATDNAVARFDSTTGKVIQNSTVTINDNGTLEAVNGISFDTTPTSAPTAVGSLSWNSSDGTLDLVMKGGNVVQQIGEEQYYTVRNETGSTIANGTPVMSNGVTSGSGRITVTPAIANGSIDELRFIGLTTESITNGINGYVTSFGYVRGLDTRGTPYGETWAEGDFIYVSSSTAGYLTNVEPTAPNLKIVVGIVITRNQTSGILLVRPTAYPHITHLSDVNISSPTSGNLLIYDAPQNRWENADLTASTGISVTNGAGSVTITNTAPDQVVSLTGAGTTSISGTYPNFTISSDDQFDGTVTSVDLTASTGISVSGGPITGSGSITVTNTAPDQTVVLTAGTGISTSGTYPNFTITNTSPSSGGTVTSVGGTGTVNGISLSGTVTSSGNLTLGGTLSGVSLTSQVSGTLPIANGGTGETTRQAAMDALAGAVTSGQYLRGNGTDVVMSAIQAADVPTLNQNTTGTASNVTGTVAIANGGTGQTTATAAFNALNPMTTTGDIIYEASATVAARLPIGSTGQVLTVSGGIPAWSAAPSSNITTQGLYENSATISANYTIGSGNNAMSAGPITINSGVTVTVPTGSTWTVV